MLDLECYLAICHFVANDTFLPNLPPLAVKTGTGTCIWFVAVAPVEQWASYLANCICGFTSLSLWLFLYAMQASRENEEIGVMFMERAANAGDRSAMIYLAKAYESGIGLGINRLV